MLLGRFQLYNWDPIIPLPFQKLSKLLSKLSTEDMKEPLLKEINGLEKPFTGSWSAFHDSLSSMGDLSIKKVMRFHQCSLVGIFRGDLSYNTSSLFLCPAAACLQGPKCWWSQSIPFFGRWCQKSSVQHSKGKGGIESFDRRSQDRAHSAAEAGWILWWRSPACEKQLGWAIPIWNRAFFCNAKIVSPTIVPIP